MANLPQRVREIPQRSPQLSDSVASYIRDLILTGEVRSGEYLRVERISKDMGVSMTPVREALAALRREGFVDQEPRRGFVAVGLSAQDVRDIFGQLATISAELAARAVGVLTPADIGRLSDILESLEDVAIAGTGDEASRLHFEFHRVINTASGSTKLQWILGMLTRYVPRSLFSTIPGWWEASVPEHREILTALRKQELDRVRAAVSKHLMRAGALLVDHLAAKESLEAEKA